MRIWVAYKPDPSMTAINSTGTWSVWKGLRVSSIFQVQDQIKMRIEVTGITFEYQRMTTTSLPFWNSQVSMLQENKKLLYDLWNTLSWNLLHSVQNIYLLALLKILTLTLYSENWTPTYILILWYKNKFWANILDKREDDWRNVVRQRKSMHKLT